MSISVKIKNLAKENNHTLASLERALDLGNGSIRRWDTNSPSADKLIKVANFLNTSVDYLLGRNEEISLPAQNDQEAKLIELYRSLKPLEQARILLLANKLANTPSESTEKIVAFGGNEDIYNSKIDKK